MVYSIRFSDDVHPPQGARIIATVREIDTGKAVFVRCWAGTMPASGFFVGDVAGNVPTFSFCRSIAVLSAKLPGGVNAGFARRGKYKGVTLSGFD